MPEVYLRNPASDPRYALRRSLRSTESGSSGHFSQPSLLKSQFCLACSGRSERAPDIRVVLFARYASVKSSLEFVRSPATQNPRSIRKPK